MGVIHLNSLDQDTDRSFGKLYDYNMKLMRLSERKNSDNDLSFDSIIDFYITSHGISLTKNMYHGYWDSPGMLQNARCILEGLALKTMFHAGDISPDQIKLIKPQTALLEHRYYSRFNEIIDCIVIPEDLDKQYKAACDEYHQALDGKCNHKRIKHILKSNIPFLCNPDASYRGLIYRYLGEGAASVYGLFSQAVHPSANMSYRDDEYSKGVLLVYAALKEEYDSLPSSKVTLQDYTKLCMTPIPQLQRKAIGAQAEIYLKIANVFNDYFGYNYVSDTLMTYSVLKQEMLFDTQTGFREQTKSKWKVMLELLAAFFYVYVEQEYIDLRYRLLKEHQESMILQNFGSNVNLEEAYAIYLEMYPNGCDRTKFEESFLKLTGYTIDENSNTISINSMVNSFVTTLCNGDAKLEQMLKIDYCESQMISHANGYMWFANQGAWMDVYNIFLFSDVGMELILSSIKALFEQIRKEEGISKYKPIENVLRNGIRALKPETAKLLELLKMPVVGLS